MIKRMKTTKLSQLHPKNGSSFSFSAVFRRRCGWVNNSARRNRFLKHGRSLEHYHLATTFSVFAKLQNGNAKQIFNTEKAKTLLTSCTSYFRGCAYTWSGFIFWKPNLSVHIDSASSAAGRTTLFTFKNASSFSMHENNNWK